MLWTPRRPAAGPCRFRVERQGSRAGTERQGTLLASGPLCGIRPHASRVCVVRHRPGGGRSGRSQGLPRHLSRLLPGLVGRAGALRGASAAPFLPAPGHPAGLPRDPGPPGDRGPPAGRAPPREAAGAPRASRGQPGSPTVPRPDRGGHPLRGWLLVSRAGRGGVCRTPHPHGRRAGPSRAGASERRGSLAPASLHPRGIPLSVRCGSRPARREGPGSPVPADVRLLTNGTFSVGGGPTPWGARGRLGPTGIPGSPGDPGAAEAKSDAGFA